MANRQLTGSSPRMWGTLWPWYRPSVGARFIPTHVGNARRCGDNAIGLTVHPHACGERINRLDWPHLHNGSSPRMWGTLKLFTDIAILARFIPTHVGNALVLIVTTMRTAVHPHACGERMSRSISMTAISGSSPRMWGTPRQRRLGWGRYRFIPTHVGNAYSY